jgi:hypothetical protein
MAWMAGCLQYAKDEKKTKNTPLGIAAPAMMADMALM